MSDPIERQNKSETHDKCTETHACDLVDRQEAIKVATRFRVTPGGEIFEAIRMAVKTELEQLPAAQPDYQEVLGWLLAYHTMSFDLHGRYLPHEVISWLINDFTKEFIAERGQNG